MINLDSNKVLSGTDGVTYINGVILSELTGTEIKVTGKFEDVNVCGELSTSHKFVGYSVEGTIKLQKITSRGMRLVAAAYQTGVMPDIKIITSLTNKATGQSERTSISDVVITEFMLAHFEAKKLAEETLPIKASTYEVLEMLS